MCGQADGESYGRERGEAGQHTTRVAPLMARLGPESWARKINAGYYGYR